MNILNIDTSEGLAEFEAQVALQAELTSYVSDFNSTMGSLFEHYTITPTVAQFLHEQVAADFAKEIEPYILQTGINTKGELYVVVGAKHD